jgi:ATP-binding cassette subfamily C protein
MTELGMDPLAERLGGLDGPVDPGALSSGERALVALARVHLSDARLVILDEATRHLDATAERRVEEAFRRRPGTVVTVAHRLSVARRADRVLLLDGTRPAIGTHDALLARVPLYADLRGHWHDGAAGAGRPLTGRSGPGRTRDGLSTPGAASGRSSSRPAADPAP